MHMSPRPSLQAPAHSFRELLCPNVEGKYSAPTLTSTLNNQLALLDSSQELPTAPLPVPLTGAWASPVTLVDSCQLGII